MPPACTYLAFVFVPTDLLHLPRRAVIGRYIPHRVLGIVLDTPAWWRVDADSFANNIYVVVVVEVIIDEVISEIVNMEPDGEVNEGRLCSIGWFCCSSTS
jgi:hypothetical protein